MVREKLVDKFGSLFFRNVTVGFKVENIDAPWEYSEEPHINRRQVRFKTKLQGVNKYTFGHG